MEEPLEIYGLRAVMEALEAGKVPERIFVQRGLSGPLFKKLQDAARKQGTDLSVVPAERLKKFASRNHQGVVATLAPIRYRDYTELIDQSLATGNPPLFLLLDAISDVRNLGAIIRTAACTGVSGMILPASGSAPISADTIKTSAGAAFTVPIARCPHLKDVIYYLQASGVRVVAATEKSDELLFNTDLTGPVAILMGSEGSGINPSLLKLCDSTARLPMTGTIASLNVSVACGVFLYEVVRQRRG